MSESNVPSMHIRMKRGGFQIYNNVTYTTYDWGIHIVADDQEDVIPWHAIEQIDVRRSTSEEE